MEDLRPRQPQEMIEDEQSIPDEEQKLIDDVDSDIDLDSENGAL